MSDPEIKPESKKLTLEDPVAPETLKKLERLTNSWQDLAAKLMELEQHKVRLIVAARQLDDERGRVIDRELTLRGMSAGTPVSIDSDTGKIELGSPPEPGAKPVA